MRFLYDFKEKRSLFLIMEEFIGRLTQFVEKSSALEKPVCERCSFLITFSGLSN